MIETTLTGKTPDIGEENIKKLMTMFPEVVTEGKVDFEKLKQVLGEYVEDSNERYNFTWNGKGRALRLSQTPSLGTLRPCKEESKNWDTTQNLYIEGDNLEVLKLLQKSYYGKIKMIYIDPPYNTGKDFVYKDDFYDSIENYKRITGQIDGNGKAISTNTETSGRYHTDWLNMMYPRLRLARNLLSDDGVIFISIDDNEVDNLKKICNEIFGEDNFIAILIRKTGATRAMAKHFDIRHDYVVVYAKNINNLELNESINEKAIQYVNWDNDIKGPWDSQDLTVRTGGYEYAIPSINFRKKFIRKWRYPEAILKQKMGYKEDTPYEVIYSNTTYIPKKGWYTVGEFVFKGENNIINQKKYSSEVSTIVNHTLPSNIGSNKVGGMIVRNLFDMNSDVFDNPKPVELLKYLLFIGTNKNSITLDFFSGSATTAHAVMQLNAEDGGNRKFIMVQLPEPTDENSEAYKAGYKNICEIGKERIRRAGEKIKAEYKDKENIENLDIGFKVFKLDTSNIRKWQPDYDNLEQSLLEYVDNYVEGRTELDVVYEIMFKYGLDLTYPVDEFIIAQKKVYSIGFGMLMICLDDEITTEIAKGILEKIKELSPESSRVVFKDNGFKTDSNKTNIKEILKCGGIEEFITL